MKHNRLTFIMLCVAILVACGSRSYKDGRTVSLMILKTSSLDTLSVSNMVNLLDSMISPEIFGRDFAMSIVSMAESDTVLNGADLYKRLDLLRHVYIANRGDKAFKRFDEGVQSFINALPVEQKMFFYARIATPEQLGTALRIDRYRNPGDSLKISEQIAALKNYYDEEQLSLFLKYYNR